MVDVVATRVQQVYGDQKCFTDAQERASKLVRQQLNSRASFADVTRHLATLRQRLARVQAVERTQTDRGLSERCVDSTVRFGLARHPHLGATLGYDTEAFGSDNADDDGKLRTVNEKCSAALQRWQSESGEQSATNGGCITPLTCEVKYVQYHATVTRLCGLQKAETVLRAPLDSGKVIIARFFRPNLTTHDITMRHAECTDHVAILERCERSHRLVLDAYHANDCDALVDALVDVCYWSSIAMFHFRGSGAIGKWYALGILRAAFGNERITVPGARYNPDLDAVLARSLAEFGANWRQQFGLDARPASLLRAGVLRPHTVAVLFVQDSEHYYTSKHVKCWIAHLKRCCATVCIVCQHRDSTIGDNVAPLGVQVFERPGERDCMQHLATVLQHADATKTDWSAVRRVLYVDASLVWCDAPIGNGPTALERLLNYAESEQRADVLTLADDQYSAVAPLFFLLNGTVAIGALRDLLLDAQPSSFEHWCKRYRLKRKALVSQCETMFGAHKGHRLLISDWRAPFAFDLPLLHVDLLSGRYDALLRHTPSLDSRFAPRVVFRYIGWRWRLHGAADLARLVQDEYTVPALHVNSLLSDAVYYAQRSRHLRKNLAFDSAVFQRSVAAALQSRTRLIVYTVCLGGIDDAVALADNLPTGLLAAFDVRVLLFTDERRLVAGAPNRPDWTRFFDDVILVRRDPLLDAQKLSRCIKWCPHRFLPPKWLQWSDLSLYVDAYIGLDWNLSLERFLQTRNETERLVLCRHASRDCVYREIDAVREQQKDSEASLQCVLADLRSASYPERNGLSDNNVLWRRHSDAQVQACMDDIVLRVLRWSRRDQVAVQPVLFQRNVEAKMVQCAQQDANFVLAYSSHGVSRANPFRRVHSVKASLQCGTERRDVTDTVQTFLTEQNSDSYLLLNAERVDDLWNLIDDQQQEAPVTLHLHWSNDPTHVSCVALSKRSSRETKTIDDVPILSADRSIHSSSFRLGDLPALCLQ